MKSVDYAKFSRIIQTSRQVRAAAVAAIACSRENNEPIEGYMLEGQGHARAVVPSFPHVRFERPRWRP